MALTLRLGRVTLAARRGRSTFSERYRIGGMHACRLFGLIFKASWQAPHRGLRSSARV